MGGKLGALQRLMAWAREAEKASGVERSAKYFYDASRALDPKLMEQSSAETERLIRAAQQGHNAIVTRFSRPTRDEMHLEAMRDRWYELPGEERGFHVDLTPSGPAALARMNNMNYRSSAVQPRPLSIIMRKPAAVTDEIANDADALTKLRRKGTDTVIYSPTRGEIWPSGTDVPYTSADTELFIESLRPGQWQPSAAVLKPENVRDIRAEFANPRATGLNYARGGLAQYRRCNCGR